MPKLTLLLGRRTLQVYDMDQPTIRVGRADEMDIVIDNPSVSRQQAVFRMMEGGMWVVEDLGSSNGTFIGETRIDGPHPVTEGDEVGFGKFSIVFGKVVGDAPAAPATPAPARATMGSPAEGTMHIKGAEVQALLKDSERKRRSHLVWEAGGQTGTHYLSEGPAVLCGTDELCDVRVPVGPKHHILVLGVGEGYEVRNLQTGWGARMTVSGRTTKRATLKDGDVVEAKGMKLTFVADIK